MERQEVRVYYYNGHNTMSVDKHLAIDIKKTEDYIEIVAEELLDNSEGEDIYVEHLRYTYPRTKIIKVVEVI